MSAQLEDTCCVCLGHVVLDPNAGGDKSMSVSDARTLHRAWTMLQAKMVRRQISRLPAGCSC